MTNPNIDPTALTQALAQLRASLPGTPRDYMNNTAAAAMTHTVPEAFRLIEKFIERTTESEMWPVTGEVTHEEDGTLTIRVVPSATP